MKLLRTITFFDPRYKSRVPDLCEGHLKNTIQKFVYEHEADYIQPTQGQELQNITNSNLATPPPGHFTRNMANQANVLSPEAQMFKELLTDDAQEGQVVNNTTLQKKLIQKLIIIHNLHLQKQKNLKLIVLDWWKAQQKQFPNIFQILTNTHWR